MYSFIKNMVTASINSILKKQIFITLLFLILLAGIVYCASPAITHYGLQIFNDGIQVKDPNTASINSTGDARVHSLGVNCATDPNYQIKGNSFSVDNSGNSTFRYYYGIPGHDLFIVPFSTNAVRIADGDNNQIATLNYLGLKLENNRCLALAGATADPNYLIYHSKFNIDPNGAITAAAGTDTTFTFGRGKVWGSSDVAYFSHFDNDTTSNYALKQDTNGDVHLNCKSGSILYLRYGNTYFGRFDSSTTFSMYGNTTKTITMQRHFDDNTAGNALTIQAGGCTALATDKNGGNLILKSGIPTGNGGSQIDFYGVTINQGAGTTDRNPTLTASIDGNGLTMVSGKTITIDGLTIQAKAGSLADDATIALPSGISGWGEIQCGDDEEWCTVKFKADGTITLRENSPNISTSDTDGEFCIYSNAGVITIKNRLGSSKNVAYKFEYRIIP